MKQVLVRMYYETDQRAVWREVVASERETLKSLSLTIETVFDLGKAPFEYEVLGWRAPGLRVKMMDLLGSGVTRFRYVPKDASGRPVTVFISRIAESLLVPGVKKSASAGEE